MKDCGQHLLSELISHFRAKGTPADLLSIYYLWPIIGMANRRFSEPMRCQHMPRAYELSLAAPKQTNTKLSLRSYLKWKFRASQSFKSFQGKLLFPVPSTRLKSIIRSVCAKNKTSVLIADYYGEYDECHVSIDDFRTPPFFVSTRRALHFVDIVKKTFEAYNLTLTDEEVFFIKQNHLQNQIDYRSTVSILEKLRPSAIVVHADNHPPHQTYVLAAQELNVPTIMIQHGLDCEAYTLDEAYADHLLLWGEERLQRYRANSINQNFQATIVGSLEHEHIEMKASKKLDRNQWLWVTRPHSPDKCYTANRWPDEGYRILRAMVGALESYPDAYLVIKPHPYEKTDLYRDLMKKLPASVRSRISIKLSSIESAVSSAGIVFTEDSSAGLDAMLQSKLLIQVHFCEDLPAIRYAENGAAQYAGDPEELKSAIDSLMCFSEHDIQAMADAQSRLTCSLIGTQDGLAVARAIEILSDYL